MRLIPFPGRVVGGEINFKDENLLEKSDKEIRQIRGAKIGMSFQDPITYLNPVIPVGKQIAECIEIHQNLSKKESMDEAIKILDLVRIADPLERVKDYPFQLSGGVCLSIKLILNGSYGAIIEADEAIIIKHITIINPTTATLFFLYIFQNDFILPYISL